MNSEKQFGQGGLSKRKKGKKGPGVDIFLNPLQFSQGLVCKNIPAR